MPRVLVPRRALTSVVASLLAVLVIAPAAQGKQKYRYFQDLSVTGPFPGQIFFTVTYRDNRGNGRFTPREVVSYRLQVGVSCNTGNPGDLRISGNEFNKYGYFREVLQSGRFAHRFEDQFESPQVAPLKGDLNGTVLKRLKRGNQVIRTARVNGAFDVEDWDPAPGIADCISVGSYSATPCKRWLSPRAPKYSQWKRWNLPVCRETW